MNNDINNTLLEWLRPQLNQDRVILAIDGIDGSGKSTFAQKLQRYLKMYLTEFEIIHSSVDYFHNTRSVRYNRGKDSPEGFFYDSYNYGVLIQELLLPFRDSRTDKVMAKYFDHREDREKLEILHVPKKAILILDGIFLHRDELIKLWDCSIFLRVSFDESYRRMSLRDGSNMDPAHSSNIRYYCGQKLYLDSCRPVSRAQLVIDNNDYSAPLIVTK